MQIDIDNAPGDDCRVPLEGGFNLRDFGGQRTMDGRRVRRGMLYRSGTMALLTEADAQRLQILGIRTICDFRRQNERRVEPTLWHGEDVDYYCRDYDETSGVLMEMLKAEHTTPAEMRDAMLDLYRSLHIDHAESYRAMFQRLGEGRVPMIINCSAGKDRTGVGAALVLWTLGVPRETIFDDYLLTNVHSDWDWLMAQRKMAHLRVLRPDPEVLAAMKSADAAYLTTMFDQLDADHGGVDGYLSEVLGMDDAARQRIRDLLLES